MQRVTACSELLVVVWVWAIKNLLVWIGQPWVVVNFAHPDLEVLVHHQVHTKDFEVAVTNQFPVALDIGCLRNIASEIFGDVKDLMVETMLVEGRICVRQIRDKLSHTNLLAPTNHWLFPQEIVLVFLCGVQAEVCDMRWRIELFTQCLARERVRLSGEKALAILLHIGLKWFHVCNHHVDAQVELVSAN